MGYVDPAIPARAGGTGGAQGQKFNSHDNWCYIIVEGESQNLRLCYTTC